MSEEFATSDAIAKAKEWLDVATPRWRLQTLQHRGRYNPKTGEYRQLPTRIRRFLNGTPAGMKAAVLQVLKESAPYKAPVFDLECDGCLYMPTNTFIRKDGVEHVTNQKDATYTIIQDLRLFDELGDRFSFPDASACSEFGETEYFWDEFEVGDCPDGSQGISYQITDVSRDRETDLFSYRLRKVTALTQHMAPVVSQCDARKRVTVETWNNVYGEPGSFRWDPAKGGSAPIQLPAPCSSADGVDVKVSVSENADCTYRIELVTTEAKVDEGLFSVYRDQYKVQESERTFNAASPLPKSGVEYSGGVTTKYTSERNEDGSWNNTVDAETERHVPSSTVEVRVMPRSTTTTRVDTNAPLPASSLPAGAEFGSWKSVKTPGGLFTNEYVSFARTLFGNLGLVCSDTAFLKTHETQATADSVPAGSHVPAAGGGLVTTWNYDTDAEGIVTRRERTEREHEVREAVRRRTWGWLGTTSGYVHRSVPASVADTLLASQDKGTSVEAKMTNGRLWDVEVQTFLRVTGQSLGLDCQKTVYQHVHETAVSAAEIGEEASDAGGGRTYRRSFRLDTSTGAVTQTDTTTYELLVPESRRAVRVTARGRTVRTTVSNTPERPADASAVGESTEFEVTPGGVYNATRETTEPRPGDLARECSEDAFLHVDASARTQSAKAPDHVAQPGGGVYRERTQRLGDDGLWEVRDVDHKEKEVTGGLDVSVTARGRRRTVVTRQTAREGTEPGVDDAGKALRRAKTRGGLNDLEETEFEPREQDNGVSCSKDIFQHATGNVKVRRERDGDHVDDTADMSGLYRERTQRLGDDGLWEISDQEHQELAVESQRVEERVTRLGKVKRTTHVQVAREGSALSASSADVGKERIVEKTRGGRRNLTEVEVTPIREKTEKRCEKDAFLHSTTTVQGRDSEGDDHVDAAGGGRYRERTMRLNDLGVWEETLAEHEEEQPSWRSRDYEDAFGKTLVAENRSHEQAAGPDGAEFDAESLIRHVEAELTRGKRYNVRTVTETPTEIDSGWLHFEKETSSGLAIFYDLIVFRNATKQQVKEWVRYIQRKGYTGYNGSFFNHPTVSVSPNKFGLWDGSISLTTTFTPKAWAAGGSTQDDNYGPVEYQVKDVSVSPMNAVAREGGEGQLFLLKAVTTEYHKRGGGVGKDRLDAVLAGGALVRGSTWSYHPSGQSFQYDIITRRSVVYSIVRATAGVSTDDAGGRANA